MPVCLKKLEACLENPSRERGEGEFNKKDIMKSSFSLLALCENKNGPAPGKTLARVVFIAWCKCGMHRQLIS